jgi:Protein of unknown function (DUF2946)
MDPSVVAALAKWPDVPDVYGWLGLTVRGEWRLQGQPIGNAALREFIGRNYGSDARGRWYFQNGPQRVFVALEAAPWVWQIAQDGGNPALQSHTGVVVSELRGAWLDESGMAFLMTDLGFGLLDSRDAGRLLDALQPDGPGPTRPEDQPPGLRDDGPIAVVHGATLGLAGQAPLGRLRTDEVEERFGFVRLPRSD